MCFFKGQKFKSYLEFHETLKMYERDNACKFFVRDSRKLDLIRHKVKFEMRKELIYYEIKFCCIKGGPFKKRGIGIRSTSTLKMNCPAHISLRASSEGQHLVVKSLCFDHNHEMAEEEYIRPRKDGKYKKKPPKNLNILPGLDFLSASITSEMDEESPDNPLTSENILSKKIPKRKEKWKKIVLPSPISSKSISVNLKKNLKPWTKLEDTYMALCTSNRKLLTKLISQALKKRNEFLSTFHKMKFKWTDFEIDSSQTSSVFTLGEKIIYHASITTYRKYPVTLVVRILEQQSRFQEYLNLMYPALNHFTDFIPCDLVDHTSGTELMSMEAKILILDHSVVLSIESYAQNLPDTLKAENERESCFIIVQLIHTLKLIQARGIETLESNFEKLLLSKSETDKYFSVLFLSDNSEDESDYSSDFSKISLCRYALIAVFHLLKIQSVEEFSSVAETKFSSPMSRKVFQSVISILSKEKANSLSQAKVLMECFLWGITKTFENFIEDKDIDVMLDRFLDIERSKYVTEMINEDTDNNIFNIQSEFFSNFLIRVTAKSIKEVLSTLKSIEL